MKQKTEQKLIPGLFIYGQDFYYSLVDLKLSTTKENKERERERKKENNTILTLIASIRRVVYK